MIWKTAKNYSLSWMLIVRILMLNDKVKDGSIILMHNDAEHTPKALPTILKTLQDDGYEFVLIEDLIYKENYEIKHDGTQAINRN